ncbi:MAG TPA: prolyl oligopeptidase family serine peptidase, partial [Saprospiraceae bacterium]|nr:prolyl oligopeptidase family serine peptidase [Saprospiraceae bacterium]
PAKTTRPKPKKEDKENGYRLILRHLDTGRQDTFAYVTEYALAKRAPALLLASSGIGDTLNFPAQPNARRAGVYHYDIRRGVLSPIQRGKGKYQQLALDDYGRQAAYLSDVDTTKARIRPWQLRHWTGQEQDTAHVLASPARPIPGSQGMLPSEHSRPAFSEDGSKLYFGIAPPPLLNDTTLLPEEIVQLEVWAWTEKRLYTQQEVQMEAEKKRTYPAVWHTQQQHFALLGSPDLPEIRYTESRNAPLALGYTEEPYAFYLTGEGSPHKDLYAVNIHDGSRQPVLKDLRCNPRISPQAQYIVWWSAPDSAWYAWQARSATTARLTHNLAVKYYDEENDQPDYPDEYGLAGWWPDDEALLVYDRYDIWKLDPKGKQPAERLTRGREADIIYRYLRLDPEERHIDYKKWGLLHATHRRSKAEGYVLINWLSGELSPITPAVSAQSSGSSAYAYSRQPLKAKASERLVYSQENFGTFPDLLYAALPSARAAQPLLQSVRISSANPQQADYQWGSIEMVQWTSLSGERLSGLLVKPEGFDPARRYPMIVNFYEKNSDGLLAHRPPDFHRSQINYTYYASRGYLVFSPDIPYRTGYPGECAYDAIVSGVTALMDKGFVDPKRIALQGHSWGGYQAAYVVTRTGLFRCAEAGAPVANMTSAYGGIRWESGLSRAFQYERQQSRIGGSLWEKPKQFLENSPLFALDKVQTPLLILHNDKDGAVPWYQGIELYTGLRRLGKPAWLLNYNDEPHWPVKLQNRADFQLRMQQFFDHYLMDGPMPRWMQRGVPPVEKGILQGLD